jgi:hypothetical protein
MNSIIYDLSVHQVLDIVLFYIDANRESSGIPEPSSIDLDFIDAACSFMIEQLDMILEPPSLGDEITRHYKTQIFDQIVDIFGDALVCQSYN